ncbi:pirin-like C-terminal cupin domain-containing protein [Collimonas sp. OK607]|uniref:pirin-like C-terminal cupin domain-containing protein n=1 Tax=Collimonas sp. OK607 TaxID=1798194 RepID=UPI000B812FA8
MTTAIVPEKHAHLLLLSASPINEPTAEYGTFMMNTEEELAATYDRYLQGKMGRLPKL